MRRVTVSSLAMFGILSAIVPAVSQRFGQMRNRTEIFVVTITLPGEECVDRMMEVITPLCIEGIAATLARQY